MTRARISESTKNELQLKRDILTQNKEQIDLDVQDANHKLAEQQHKTRQYDIELKKQKSRASVDKQKIDLEIESIDRQLNLIKHGHVVEQSTETHIKPVIDSEMLWPLKICNDQSAFNLSPNIQARVIAQFEDTTGPEHVVSRAKEQSKKDNLSNTCNKYENVVLIVCYNRDELDRRRQCIRDATSRNLNNEHIDNIVMFVYTDNKKIDVAKELFSGDVPGGVTTMITDKPATYQQVLKFISTEIVQSTPTCFIVAKPDVVLPEEIECLKKLNLRNKIVCMSEPVTRNYWKTDAWLFDSSIVTNTTIGEDLPVGSDTAAELFLQQAYQAMITLHNVSICDHVVVEKFDGSGHVSEHIEIEKQHDKQWPFAQNITLQNYIVGDTCGYSKCNFYYDDRFTGEPGKYFTRDIKSLAYEYTSSVCVFYMSCMKEVKNGSLYKCIHDFFSKPVSKERSFDLHICLDYVDQHVNIVSNIEKILIQCGGCMVNSVNIQSADLSREDNVFTYDLKKYKQSKQLPLGASHGINQSFYTCLEKMQTANRGKYKYMLMLESDCIAVGDYWFDDVYTYCQTKPDIIVAGSKHKGLSDGHRISYYADHINGVAIYKNSKELTTLLKGGYSYIKQWVKNNDKPLMNFDVGNYLFAKEHGIQDKLIDIDIISNYSSAENTHLTVNQVLERHPDTVILHKKIPVAS